MDNARPAVGNSQQLSAAKNQTLTHSPQSSELATALQALCSMKTQAQFTPHQLATWAAVLGQYPTGTINRAVLMLGLSTDPFPDLSKVVRQCEQIESERNPQVVRGNVSEKPSRQLIQNTAAALGFDIR